MIYIYIIDYILIEKGNNCFLIYKYKLISILNLNKLKKYLYLSLYIYIFNNVSKKEVEISKIIILTFLHRWYIRCICNNVNSTNRYIKSTNTSSIITKRKTIIKKTNIYI